MPRIRKTPGKNGFVYKPKFGVVITCKSEDEQAATYEKLKAAGHKCKVVTI